jgi:hypothetical protein
MQHLAAFITAVKSFEVQASSFSHCEAYSAKLFTVVLYTPNVFHSVRHFLPSLIFPSKDGAYPSGAFNSV